MIISNSANKNFSPVAIGGVGGSGTRIIAQLLKELGFYIGSDLNEANDNLWFTLLFKRIEILSAIDNIFAEMVVIFVDGMTRSREFTESQIKLINTLSLLDRAQHPANWLRERANSLISTKPSSPKIAAWGWKEPNTHIVMDRLPKFLPNMKYIHVVRNGLDMAHSANQNQLKLWGPRFIGASYKLSPYYSLRYWHRIHKRALELGASMGSRFHFLNYDQFCSDPTNGIKKLIEFLEIKKSKRYINKLSNLVKFPESIGRFKKHGLHVFDPADISFVRQLGFDTSLD